MGKSYASEILLRKFAKDGKKVGYFKPIETGVENIPVDGTKLLNITKTLNPDFNFSVDDIVAFKFKLPASPFVAKEKSNIDIDIIIKKAKDILKYCDALIVEGAGGLMVPIEKNYFMIDLILEFQEKLNSQTILIVPSNLGGINDTMLSQRMLESYNINYSWYINLYKNKDSFSNITLPFYKEYFDKISFL